MKSGSVVPFGSSVPGRFWTGNIHCHSDRSDGHETVEAVVAAYRDAGHDFLCITDHFEEEYGWQVTNGAVHSRGNFLILVGAEFSSGAWREPDCYWVNAIGLAPGFQPQAQGESGASSIARAHESGAFMVLLHPGLNNLSLQSALTIDHIHAVEIHNTGMMMTFPDAVDGHYILDGLLKNGRKLFVAAGDDAHGFHPWEKFGNFLRISATELSAESIVAALKAGCYYTSQGPRIDDVRIDDGHLFIDTSEARSIAISGRNWLDARSVQGEPLTSASFSLAAFHGSYFRITVVDAAGKRCWSNPIYPDQEPTA